MNIFVALHEYNQQNQHELSPIGTVVINQPITKTTNIQHI